MKLLLVAAVVALASIDCSRLHAEQPTADSCSVKSGHYLGWEAKIVSNRWVTLTFIPQLGGRLMQVEFNGHQYLFVNPRFRGRYIAPAEAKGDWINYGGDKIWPMPEGSQDENHWMLQSTAIDDLPYRFEMLSQGRECVVRLTGQLDNITGLRITRTIHLGADSPEIRFHAVMENATAHPITWSIQSVSQYDLADPDKPDEFNHNLWAFTPRNLASSFPEGYHVRYGLAEDPAFSTTEDLFRLHWTWFGNEVWLDSTAGWLAVVDKTSRYGMVESFNVVPGADYPGKTTVIFYKNGPSVHFDEKGSASITGSSPSTTPYYMEAEINSPMIMLRSGETYGFDTVWHPIAIAAQPLEMRAAGAVVERLRTEWKGSQLSLRGAFSVFSSGKLIALFFNQRGIELARREVASVDPAHSTVLDSTMPAVEGAVRIRLELMGLSNEDRGTLAVVQMEAK